MNLPCTERRQTLPISPISCATSSLPSVHNHSLKRDCRTYRRWTLQQWLARWIENCWHIRKAQTWINENYKIIWGHVGWSIETENNFKAPGLASLRRCPTCAQCTLPSWTNGETTGHKQIRQNAERRHYRTRNNRVGEVSHLCTEEERLAPILCRLLKAVRRNC